MIAEADRFDTSSMRVWGSGAAPLPLEIVEPFERKFGGRLLEGYGLTEAGTAITLVLPEQQVETSRVARRLGHREQYEQSGLRSARPKLLYTSRRGRRSKW